VGWPGLGLGAGKGVRRNHKSGETGVFVGKVRTGARLIKGGGWN